MMNRRDFLDNLAGLALAGIASPAATALAQESGFDPAHLPLWAIGDAHVGRT